MKANRLILIFMFICWNVIVIAAATQMFDRPEIQIQGIELILIVIAAVFISYRIGKAAGQSMLEDESQKQDTPEDTLVLLSSQSESPEEDQYYGPFPLENSEVSEFVRAVSSGSIFLN